MNLLTGAVWEEPTNLHEPFRWDCIHVRQVIESTDASMWVHCTQLSCCTDSTLRVLCSEALAVGRSVNAPFCVH